MPASALLILLMRGLSARTHGFVRRIEDWLRPEAMLSPASRCRSSEFATATYEELQTTPYARFVRHCWAQDGLVICAFSSKVYTEGRWLANRCCPIPLLITSSPRWQPPLTRYLRLDVDVAFAARLYMESGDGVLLLLSPPATECRAGSSGI